MRCSLLRLWLGTGIVTCLLTCGCQQSRQCCSTCGGCAAGASTAPVVYGYAPTMVGASFIPVNAAAPVGSNVPVVHTTAKPVSPVAGTTPQSGQAIVGGQGGMLPPIKNAQDDSTPRPTFTDPTAHAGFAHAPNYQWLVGTLDYSRTQGAWILRYASVEDEDRYGGIVTLDCPNRMNAFKSGQLVRVEGHLIDPESHQIRPAFEVRTIVPMRP
jgi:hypothetical protein